ncbi:MAG: hypothetical protein EHM83_05660, partial [Burkholderiales bacterium]
MDARPPWRARVARLLSHQAIGTAVALFVALWTIPTLVRVALTAIRWPELDHDPSALLAAYARGVAIDALLAFATAALVLAFGALAHFGARDGANLRARRTLGFGIAVAAIGFVGIAEILFWDEFGVRFNFIAVDYLIYTVEVIGNIRESYPIPALLGGLAVFGAAAAWLRNRVWPVRAQAGWPLRLRTGVALLAIATSVGAARIGITLNDGVESVAGLRANARNQELARNGPASFAAALRDNELSFRRFYATLDDGRVARLAGSWPRRAAPARPVRASWPPADATPVAGSGAAHAGASSVGRAASVGTRRPRHVVIVQVESLSADFLGVFGNRKGLTPNLDRLARDGVLFTDL